MNASRRILAILALAASSLVLLPSGRAAADSIGPADTGLFEGSLYDRQARRHPHGAVLLSKDRDRRVRLFVPEGRATSPRLVWRHDLTILRIHGAATVVDLKVDGRWYEFTTQDGDAVAEYDLEELRAIDGLERIVVEIPRTTRPVRRPAPARPAGSSRGYRGPHIHIDLGLFLKLGKRHPGSTKAPKGSGQNGSAGRPTLPGLPPMVPPGQLKDNRKDKFAKIKSWKKAIVPNYGKILKWAKAKQAPKYAKAKSLKKATVPNYGKILKWAKAKQAPKFAKVKSVKRAVLPNYGKIIQWTKAKQAAPKVARMKGYHRFVRPDLAKLLQKR